MARCLKGVPRKAQQYPAQEKSKAHLEVHVDSDWAGDTVTRRSTTGVIVRRSSTVQNVIGLSSAESEYNALTKGGCSGLGLQNLFADWNLILQLSLHTDSSSAKAIASRRGTGKSTRHIQTRMLCAMAARTRSSKTLTSCESSIRIKFCRHVDKSSWKIEKLRNSVQSDWTN